MVDSEGVERRKKNLIGGSELAVRGRERGGKTGRMKGVVLAGVVGPATWLGQAEREERAVTAEMGHVGLFGRKKRKKREIGRGPWAGKKKESSGEEGFSD